MAERRRDHRLHRGDDFGLIYTYNRGQYRWTPYLYYWWGPWLFAWICGIFAGYAAYKNVPQSGEKLVDARHAEGMWPG